MNEPKTKPKTRKPTRRRGFTYPYPDAWVETIRTISKSYGRELSAADLCELVNLEITRRMGDFHIRTEAKKILDAQRAKQDRAAGLISDA